MASSAEQFAKNLSWGSFARASELHKRLIFTLLALCAYRLGTFIPIPGVDPVVFAQQLQGAGANFLGIANVFSGGAVERLGIFALNVMPYISASIIIQLMSTAVPSLEKLKKDGEAGRKQLNQYTRYLTVALALAQAFGVALGLQGQQGVVANPGLMFVVSTVATLVGGTMLLMWIGEQITARGVGQGISLIIFTGIVAELPRAIYQVLDSARVGTMNGFVLLVIALLAVATIGFIVFIERSQRRLLVQYPKRQSGSRMFMGDTSFLPLKINTAGVIPPIFASSLLLFPGVLAGLAASGGGGPEWLQMVATQLGHGRPLFMLSYALLIIFFAFFYTSIVFNPDETAENLRKYGGFLPGIRPGKKTAEYLDFVLTRLTVIGALYLALVCLMPEFLMSQSNVPTMLVGFLGGTSIMIVVSVTLDTVTQVQSHLLAHQYEGLIKKSRLNRRSGKAN
jgi:preprotein translocase subunit SecY